MELDNHLCNHWCNQWCNLWLQLHTLTHVEKMKLETLLVQTDVYQTLIAMEWENVMQIICVKVKVDVQAHLNHQNKQRNQSKFNAKQLKEKKA